MTIEQSCNPSFGLPSNSSGLHHIIRAVSRVQKNHCSIYISITVRTVQICSNESTLLIKYPTQAPGIQLIYVFVNSWTITVSLSPRLTPMFVTVDMGVFHSTDVIDFVRLCRSATIFLKTSSVWYESMWQEFSDLTESLRFIAIVIIFVGVMSIICSRRSIHDTSLSHTPIVCRYSDQRPNWTLS